LKNKKNMNECQERSIIDKTQPQIALDQVRYKRYSDRTIQFPDKTEDKSLIDKTQPQVTIPERQNLTDRLRHQRRINGAVRIVEHDLSSRREPHVVEERLVVGGEGLYVTGVIDINFAGGVVCDSTDPRAQINVHGIEGADYDHRPEVMIHGGRSCVPINVENGRLYLDHGFQADVGLTVGENGRVYLDDAAIAGGIHLSGDSARVALEGSTRVTGDLEFEGRDCEINIWGDRVKVSREGRVIIQPGMTVYYDGDPYTDGDELRWAMGDVFSDDFVIGSVPYQVAHAIESIPGRIVETAPRQIRRIGQAVGTSLIDQANQQEVERARGERVPRHHMVHRDGIVDNAQAAVPSLINESVSEVLNAGEDLLRFGDEHIGRPINERIENTGRAVRRVEAYITEQGQQAAETIDRLANDVGRLNRFIADEVAHARWGIHREIDDRLLWPVRRKIRHLRWVVEDNVEAARRNINRIMERITQRRNYTPLPFEEFSEESDVSLPDFPASSNQPELESNAAPELEVAAPLVKTPSAELLRLLDLLDHVRAEPVSAPPVQESSVEAAVSVRPKSRSESRKSPSPTPIFNAVGEAASDAAAQVAITVRADDEDRIPVFLGEPSALPVEPGQAAEVVEAPAKTGVVAETPAVNNLTGQTRMATSAGALFSGEAVESASRIAIPRVETLSDVRTMLDEAAQTGAIIERELSIPGLVQMVEASWPTIETGIKAVIHRNLPWVLKWVPGIMKFSISEQNPVQIRIQPDGMVRMSLGVVVGDVKGKIASVPILITTGLTTNVNGTDYTIIATTEPPRLDFGPLHEDIQGRIGSYLGTQTLGSLVGIGIGALNRRELQAAKKPEDVARKEVEGFEIHASGEDAFAIKAAVKVIHLTQGTTIYKKDGLSYTVAEINQLKNDEWEIDMIKSGDKKPTKVKLIKLAEELAKDSETADWHW